MLLLLLLLLLLLPPRPCCCILVWKLKGKERKGIIFPVAIGQREVCMRQCHNANTDMMRLHGGGSACSFLVVTEDTFAEV